ncbi:MAG: hybrid sensor histidine kinase/response regulator [Longimicrobiales bacterium]
MQTWMYVSRARAYTRLPRFSFGRRVPLLALGLSVAAGALAPGVVWSRQAPPVPIEDVLRDADGDRVPDLLGAMIRIEGTALTATHTARDDISYIVIHDGSAAIRILARGGVFDGIVPGVRVQVRGTVRQYRGAEEVEAVEVVRRGTGAVPPPREVLASDLHGERYAHQLVRVAGVLEPAPEDAVGERFILRDRSGAIPVRLPGRFLDDPDFAARAIEGGEVVVTGIAGQADREPPFDGGYRLAPREPVDVDFAPVPPYGAIAITAILLLFGGATALLWVRRRHAERRAAELARLMVELRRSQDALARSERRYRRLFEGDVTGRFVAHPDGRVRHCNRAFAELFGFGSADAVLSARDFRISGSEGDRTLTVEAARTGTLPARELTMRRADGTALPVLVSLVAELDDSDGASLHGNVIDLTERKELERQLLQSQKMDAVGRLAGGIAHDLNNMLTAITGNVELLLAVEQTAESREELNWIRQAAQRSARLTRQLLTFSRRDVVQADVLDLNEVVREMVPMLRRMIGRDIELVTLLDESKPCVLADRSQLEQLVLNLALNARDAMPSGGKLAIETACTLGAAQPSARHVALKVTDTGVGMEAHVLERAFEPFFTTKEDGTGLGLATVYGIVQRTAGDISADSMPGRGTSIEVRMPVAALAEGEAELPQRIEAPSLTGLRILLVDDEPSIRALLQRAGRAAGIEVAVAENGEEGLRMFRQEQVDVVVTDLVMPLMGGAELASRIRAETPDMPIVFISGYSDEAGFPRDLRERWGAFLEKPFEPTALLNKIAELIARADLANCSEIDVELDPVGPTTTAEVTLPQMN